MWYAVLFYKYTGYTTCIANGFLNFSHLTYMKKIWTLLLFQWLHGIPSSGCTRTHSKVSILGSLRVLENAGFIQSTIKNLFLIIKSSIVLIISTVSTGRSIKITISQCQIYALTAVEESTQWCRVQWSKIPWKFIKQKVKGGTVWVKHYIIGLSCVRDLESNSCSEQVRRKEVEKNEQRLTAHKSWTSKAEEID